MFIRLLSDRVGLDPLSGAIFDFAWHMEESSYVISDSDNQFFERKLIFFNRL